MQTFSRETKTNNAKADILANFGGGDLSPRPQPEFLRDDPRYGIFSPPVLLPCHLSAFFTVLLLGILANAS